MFSVKCAARPIQFKVMAVESASALDVYHKRAGEVCSGGWVYFYYDIPDDEAHANGFVRFNVEKYEGDLHIKGQGGEMPLRLVFPFIDMGNDEDKTSVDVCKVYPGERVYIAIKGGRICSNFDVKVHFYVHDAENFDEEGELLACNSEAHASHTVDLHYHELKLHEFYYDHCLAGSFSEYTYKLHIDEEDLSNNLVIELEQLLEDRADPEAVSLYGFDTMYVPHLDIEGSAVFTSLSAISNIHSLTFNYVDLKAGGGLTDMSFAVKCGPNAGAKYRILAHIVKSPLVTGHLQHGEVCPESWIYHHHVVGVQGNKTDEIEGHRGLSETVADGEEAMRHEIGEPAKFLRFQFRLHKGSVYQITVRKDFPPGFNSKNLVTKHVEDVAAVMHFEEFDLDICNVQGGEKYYLGIFGNSEGCALYDVVATEYEEGEVVDGMNKTCQAGAFTVHR